VGIAAAGALTQVLAPTAVVGVAATAGATAAALAATAWTRAAWSRRSPVGGTTPPAAG
jgi:hypothetical protein